MTPEERAELDALRARLAEVEELAKHQAALSIVLYNGLQQLMALTLDLTRATSPHGGLPGVNALSSAPVVEAAMRADAGVREMSTLLDDIYDRLEPLHGYLSDAARAANAEATTSSRS